MGVKASRLEHGKKSLPIQWGDLVIGNDGTAAWGHNLRRQFSRTFQQGLPDQDLVR